MLIDRQRQLDTDGEHRAEQTSDRRSIYSQAGLLLMMLIMMVVMVVAVSF